MKKLLVLFCLIVFCLPVFAYKPIPQAKVTQYRNEIQQIIDNRYQSAMNEIDNNFTQAQLVYFKFLKKQKSSEEILLDLEDYERGIDEPEFYLYYDLIKLTNKYVDISDEIPATDWSGTLYEYLTPYFNDNSIDTHKLIELNKSAGIKQKQLNTYIQEVSKQLSF